MPQDSAWVYGGRGDRFLDHLKSGAAVFAREQQPVISGGAGNIFRASAAATPSNTGAARWNRGGTFELWPDLTWTNRPNLTGSGAPKALEDAWVAVVMAIRELKHEVKDGWCYIINLTAAPLASYALGEPAEPCSGYAGFFEEGRLRQCGLRYAPAKWAGYVNTAMSACLHPIQDQHTWVETATHVVDFDGGLGNEVWPPLIYWPKTRFPRHPREAKPGTILLWRSARSTEIVVAELATVTWAIVLRAFEILADHADIADLKQEIADLRRQSSKPFEFCDALAKSPR